MAARNISSVVAGWFTFPTLWIARDHLLFSFSALLHAGYFKHGIFLGCAHQLQRNQNYAADHRTFFTTAVSQRWMWIQVLRHFCHITGHLAIVWDNLPNNWIQSDELVGVESTNVVQIICGHVQAWIFSNKSAI